MYAGRGYVEEANDQLACIVMIETREALDNLDDILGTPGVDAAYIGPADLAYALGLSPTGDNDYPLHVETVTHIGALPASWDRRVFTQVRWRSPSAT